MLPRTTNSSGFTENAKRSDTVSPVKANAVTSKSSPRRDSKLEIAVWPAHARAMRRGGLMARALRASPEYDNAGAGVPVLCPVCGSTARRIPRKLLDRVVNVLWVVKRFHCANAMCGWEG